MSLFATGTFATVLKVEVSLRAPAAERKGIAAVWKLVPATQKASDALAKEIILPLEVPGLGGIDIPSGTWRVEIAAPGFWHAPEIVTLDGTERTIAFKLWPTTVIHGEVKPPERESIPRVLKVRFQSAPNLDSSDERLPPTQIDCPVADGEWECEIPAGQLDLRFYARGYVTHFRWGLDLTAGGNHDVGILKLRRGASVVGRVRPPPNVKVGFTNIRVVVEPLTFGNESSRSSIRSLFAVPNARGFFQVEGVPPGEYTVVARDTKSLSSASQRVAVVADTEVELIEALVLEPLKTVQVSIQPSLDPDGKPWRLRLTQATGAAGRVDSIADEIASPEGTWTRDRIRSGTYAIAVMSRAGSRWLWKEINVDRDVTPVVLRIDVTRVKGTVRLGDRGLPAKLYFGGRSGATSVILESDADGNFSGVLPKRDGDVWQEVTVESELPPVKRTLSNLKLTTDDETSRVDIELPATHIVGEVVDEDGRAVDAIVSLKGLGEFLVQRNTEKDGSFEFFGAPSGSATLQAAAGVADSDPVEVQVSEDETARVRLVARHVSSVAGSVVSAMGPVAGARVTVNPTDTTPLVVIPGMTKQSGEFVVPVQAGSREINVAVEARGFAFKMFHTRMPDKPIEIPLDQLGGTIIVDCPQFDASETSLVPQLIHSGANRVLYLIAGSKFEKSDREGYVRIRVPMIERGQYSVCLASSAEIPALRRGALPPQRCDSGFLPPLGELKLTISTDRASR